MPGRVRRISDPHGGALAVLMKNCPLTNSPFIPYPARTDMRPSPFGSQATPTRGATFSQSVNMPALPFGNPSSPGYVNPGGACGNTVLLVPGPEPIRREVVDGAVLVLLREPRLPPHAVVQRDRRRHLPRVLRVEAEVLLLHVERVRRRLLQHERAADHEVGERQPRRAAVEGEEPRRSDVGLRQRIPERHADSQAGTGDHRGSSSGRRRTNRCWCGRSRRSRCRRRY